MPRYITEQDLWLSHENRMVKAGEEFETEFPKAIKLGRNVRVVAEGGAKKAAKEPAGKDSAETLV